MKNYKRIKQDEGYYSVSPLPSSSELAEFYKQVYYQDSASATYQQFYDEDELKQKRLRADLLLHSLSLQGNSSGRFLEVGCGEGFVLNAAKEQGYSIAGVDFSSHGVEHFNPDIAQNVTTGDAFEKLDQLIECGETFDVCVLQNVLEHVIDPVGLLCRLKQVLTSSGTLVITVPNDFSELQTEVISTGKSSSEYWFAPPQHLHYFNTATLPCFVENHGYEVVDSYGDFPIEMFLFHPGSNYAEDGLLGKSAHRARIELDLLLSKNGISAYHRYCQALTGCGAGRNITVVLQVT